MSEPASATEPAKIDKTTVVSVGLVIVIVAAFVIPAFGFHTWIRDRLDGLLSEIRKNGSRLERLEERSERAAESEKAMWKRIGTHTAREGHPVTERRLDDIDRRLDKLERPK